MVGALQDSSEILGLCLRKLFRRRMRVLEMLKGTSVCVRNTLELFALIFSGKALMYASWIENHFRRSRGGELIVYELLLGYKRCRPACSLFGSLIFAEILDLVISLVGTRWIIGAFLGGCFGEQGIIISSNYVLDGHIKPKQFVTWSVKAMNRIAFNLEYCRGILI